MILRAALAMLAALFLTAPSQASAPDPSVTVLRPVETPASGPGDTLAVLYSGDGGWGPLDRDVAKVLAQEGVPVIGVNSLRYFMTRRSPQAAADDLAVSLRHYEQLWGRRKVVLVGYSFGAGALPAIVPNLPPDLRGHVAGLVLIGAGPTGDLAFRPGSWLNRAGPDAYPMAPAVEALKGLPMTCIYGDRDRHDICASLPATTIRQVRLTGSHHFDGDYKTLGHAVLRAVSL